MPRVAGSRRRTSREPATPPDDTGRMIRLVSQVVAPVTLVTALLYFFGRQRTLFFYDYFGVHESALGLTTTDYLLDAQDGLFVPLVVVAVVVLVALWLRHLRPQPFHVPRWVIGAVGVLAAAGVALGLVQMVQPGLGLAGWVPSWVPPLVFVAGVLGVEWAVRVGTPRERRTTGEAVTVFLVVGAGLFWAVANYSADVGRARALDAETRLGTGPGVVVLSVDDLGLDGPGVTVVECEEVPDGGFRYRYAGYVLLVESSSRYVVAPRQWSRDGGVISAVPVTPQVRLDFERRTAEAVPGC